jgi:hypothetical protein
MTINELPLSASDNLSPDLPVSYNIETFYRRPVKAAFSPGAVTQIRSETHVREPLYVLRTTSRLDKPIPSLLVGRQSDILALPIPGLTR